MSQDAPAFVQMEPDLDWIVDVPLHTILAPVASAVASIIGTYLYLRKQLLKLAQEDEDHTAESYRAVINTMRTRLDDLVKEVQGLSGALATARHDHEECLRHSASLRLRVATLEADLEVLRRRMGVQHTRFTVRTDADGVILDISEGVEHVLGHRPTRLVGQPISTLFPDMRADLYCARAAHVLSSETDEKALLHMLAMHFNGEDIPVVVAIARDHDCDGDKGPSVLANITEDRNELT